MQQVKENEVCLIIPASFATGEPGCPISEPLKQIIGSMTLCNYWPLDFGEADDSVIELWFQLASSYKTAEEMAQHFIKMGGDV